MNFEEATTEFLIDALPAALNNHARATVNVIVRSLLSRHAELGRQWRSLAMVMTQNGEHTAAIDAIRHYVAAEDNRPEALLDEVFTLQQAGRIAEARQVLRRIPETLPSVGQHAYLAGALDSMLGDLDAARGQLLRSVDVAPAAGQSWLALAMLKAERGDRSVGNAVIAADPRRTGRKMDHEGAYFYALGRVLSERSDHDGAFDAYRHGAAICARRQAYDRNAERQRIDQIGQGFSSDLLNRIASDVRVQTSRPIIVTGNPRSGTTLVEQILASHSQVADGGELDVMRIVVKEIGGLFEEDLLRYLKREQPDSLSNLYLHLLDERFGGAGRIVDKRLFASRTLGIIAAILPDAPIIWMRRNPMDCAWSSFRTFFNQGSPWSHDLSDIGFHFRLEDRLFDLWRNRLGSRILVVPYEALVEDADSWTRKILGHCGLQEEEAVFAPHRTNRAVTTASVMQVREPINRKGIGVAEPYRKFMQPFIDAYYD